MEEANEGRGWGCRELQGIGFQWDATSFHYLPENDGNEERGGAVVSSQELEEIDRDNGR
jgi:hypothetical protein